MARSGKKWPESATCRVREPPGDFPRTTLKARVHRVCGRKLSSAGIVEGTISLDYADDAGHLRADLPHAVGAQAAVLPDHVRGGLGCGIVAAAGRSGRRVPLGKQAWPGRIWR